VHLIVVKVRRERQKQEAVSIHSNEAEFSDQSIRVALRIITFFANISSVG
jgi:hypothetical protein